MAELLGGADDVPEGGSLAEVAAAVCDRAGSISGAGVDEVDRVDGGLAGLGDLLGWPLVLLMSGKERGRGGQHAEGREPLALQRAVCGGEEQMQGSKTKSGETPYQSGPCKGPMEIERWSRRMRRRLEPKKWQCPKTGSEAYRTGPKN